MSGSKESISFADGTSIGETREQVEYIVDPAIPWSEKVFRVAKSNGCKEPRGFMKELAEKNPEITDPEEIAKMACEVYIRQNFAYKEMVAWASKKDDQSLFVDITQTPYAREDTNECLERDVVPDWFVEGTAIGLARDPAWEIAKTIALELSSGNADEYFRLRDILQKIVDAPENTNLNQIKVKFFAAI